MLIRSLYPATLVRPVMVACALLGMSAAALAKDEEYSIEPEAPPHLEHEVRIFQEHQQRQHELRVEREEQRCEQYEGDLSDLCEDRLEEKYDD